MDLTDSRVGTEATGDGSPCYLEVTDLTGNGNGWVRTREQTR